MASSNKTASKAISSEQTIEDEYKAGTPRAIVRTGVALNTLLMLSSANAAYAGGWNMSAGPASMPQAGNFNVNHVVRAAAMAAVQPSSAAQAMSAFGARAATSNFAAGLNNFQNRAAVAAVTTTARTAMTTMVAPRLPFQTFQTGLTGKGLSLDLSSTLANVVLGAGLFRGANSATINVGGTNQSFSAGQKVTAAQYVAIKEVLGGQVQSLQLANTGSANGGSFSLNQNSVRTNLLVVPVGVTAVDNFASSRTVTIGGDIVNYGTISATTSNSRVTSGTIAGYDITNAQGGLINTLTSSNLNLTLNASNNLNNAGTIRTAGTINLLAGSGLLTNSGLVASTNGNVNLAAGASTSPVNLTVNAQGGTFQALNGNINVNSQNYTGNGNVLLTGGDFLSKNLNVYAGTGAINGSVGQVTGTLNTSAEATHLLADTATLYLGNNCAFGDPTYANSGNIVINGAVTAGEAVTILAGGNITASGNAYVSTTPLLLGGGSDITLVAGAKVTTTGTSTGTIPGLGLGITTGTATADFSAANGAKGGNIDLSGSTHNGAILDASANLLGGSAGNILLAANSVNGNGGNVTVPAGGTSGRSINASAVLGNGGNVTIFAGANPTAAATTVNIGGSIQTSGGGTFKSGNVDIETVNATASKGTAVTYNANGSLATGSATIVADLSQGAGYLSNGKVVTGDLITAAGGGLATQNGGTAGSINVQAGAISTGNLYAYGGGGGGASLGLNLGVGGTGGAGGAINLESNSASSPLTSTIVVTGDINTSGGGGGGSLGNAASGGGTAGAVSLSAAGPLNVTGNIYAGSGGAGGLFGVASTTGGGGGGSFGGGGGGAGASGLLGIGGAAGGGGAGLFGGGGGGVALLGALLGGGGGAGGGVFGGGTGGLGTLVSGLLGGLGVGGNGAATNLLGAVGGLGNTILGQGGLGGLTTNSAGLAGLGVPGLTLAQGSTQNADITATGNGMTFDGSLFGRNVALTVPVGSTADLALAHDVNGTNSVTLNQLGTGAITRLAGSINTPTLTMTTASASIGTAAAPIQTNAANLTANAGGATSNVYVNDSGAVTLTGTNSAGASGVYSLKAAGSIAAGAGETLTAGSVNLGATGVLSNIGTVAAPIHVTTANIAANATGDVNIVDDYAGTVNLGVSSAGALAGTFNLNATQAPDLNIAGNVSAHNVNLTSAGSIGEDKGTPGVVTADNLTLTATGGDIFLDTAAKTIAANASGNVNLTNQGAVQLLASSAGGGDTFSLTTTPDAFGNGTITVSGDVAATGSTPIGKIILNSSESGPGAGGIQEGAVTQGRLTASEVDLADSGNGNIGSVASPVLVNTSALSADTQGLVNVSNSNTGNLALGSMSGSAITVATAGTTSTTEDITTAGAFNLTTSGLTNDNALTAGSVHITGLSGQDLDVENSGSITATAGNVVIDSAPGQNVLIGNNGAKDPGSINVSDPFDIIVNANGDPTSTNGIIFTGDQNLNTGVLGQTILNANTSPDQFVEVQNGVTVTGNHDVVVNSANLYFDGTGQLLGNNLILNGGSVGTTISNSTGDVNLLGNVVYHGQNLTILAEGNVNTNGNFTVDLSNSSLGINAGNGGNLNIIAGYDFANVPGKTGLHAPQQITGASTAGGSVNLGNVNISTGTTVLGADGGNVLVVAHAGATNNGSISLGSIDTSAGALSPLSSAGTVTLIGQGVTTGNINSTAMVGGNTTIQSAVALVNGTIQINHGALSGGSFAADTSTFGGNVVVGAINTGNAVVTVATGGISSVTGTAAGSQITGSVLNVASGDGGIGSAAAPIYTTVSKLTAYAGANGDVYVSDASKTLNLAGVNWGSTFHLTNTNSAVITVDQMMSTNNFTIVDKGGTIVLPTSTVTALTDATTGNGGTIKLIADTITWAGQSTTALVLNAAAAATGTSRNGGTILVETNDVSNTTIGSGAGQIQLNTAAGAGGNGGSIAIIDRQGNVAVDVANGINMAVGANGNGGTLTITAQKVTSLAGGTLALSANGNGTGSGGTINLTQLGLSNVLVGSSSAADFSLSAQGTNGGTINVTAGGALTVDQSGLLYNPTALNGNGGHVSLTAQTLTGTQAGPFVLNASANILGTGNGGSASITLTKSGQAATVGLGSGQYELVALGGKKVGNGGSVSFINAGDLTVDSKAIKIAPTGANANGGSITLDAGKNGTSGTLNIVRGLSAAAKGKGVGGNISLSANGGTFTVGGSKKTVGSVVMGALSVKGKTNGNISINNDNGNVVIAKTLSAVNNVLVSAGSTTANAGNVLLAANLGSTKSNNVTIDAVGSITAKSAGKALNAAHVVLNAGTDALDNVGSKLTALSANTQDLTVKAGGLVNMLDKYARTITLNNSGAGQDFKLGTTGALLVGGALNGGSALNLSSKKGITAQSLADTLTATVVSLSGGKNGLGTQALALPVDTGSLSVLSKGAANIASVGLSDLNLANVKSTAAMTLATASDLVVNGPVSAKSLNLQSAGDILQGAGAGAALTAKSVVASAQGDLGSTAQALKTRANALSLDATGLVNAVNLSTAKSTATGVAGTSFALLANNNVTLSKVTAGAGDLTVNALKGAVSTAQGVVLQATDGKLTLQASATNGSIVLGVNSNLSTAGDNGSNVNLIVGPTVQAGTATAPAGVTTSVTPGSSINYGVGGFTLAKGATATINAHGADVQFSAAKASAIKVGSGVTITADPPTADMPFVTNGGGGPRIEFHTVLTPEASFAASPINAYAVSSITSAPAKDGSTVITAAQAAANRPHFDQEQTWVSDTELANGDIPAVVSCEQEVGITSAVSIMTDLEEALPAGSAPAYLSAAGTLSGEVSVKNLQGVKNAQGVKHVTLSRGSVVFAPQADTKVETPFGVVSIKAHSLVLVLATSESLGVYDLDDNSKGAVKVAVGGKELSLRPGVSAIVTHSHIAGLEQINPAQLFGYRSIACHNLSDKHKGFTCEFSLPQAIKCVQPLKQMVVSNHPKARQLSNHLLKTTSIMLQFSSVGGEYKQMLRSNTVACLP